MEPTLMKLKEVQIRKVRIVIKRKIVSWKGSRMAKRCRNKTVIDRMLLEICKFFA